MRKDISAKQFHQFRDNWDHKWSLDYIENASQYKKHYIYQPAGSQNYPDFIILEDQFCLSLEIKFSKNGVKPVWNSGLPRPGGIYIYAGHKQQDIVFFLGKDIVSAEESQLLHNLFDDKLDRHRQRFNQNKLKNQEYGFNVYIRKAFDQNKKYNQRVILNFFEDPNRRRNEENVFSYIRSIQS